VIVGIDGDRQHRFGILVAGIVRAPERVRPEEPALSIVARDQGVRAITDARRGAHRAADHDVAVGARRDRLRAIDPRASRAPQPRPGRETDALEARGGRGGLVRVGQSGGVAVVARRGRAPGERDEHDGEDRRSHQEASYSLAAPSDTIASARVCARSVRRGALARHRAPDDSA
jgi:hypothetical protein